MMEIISLNSCGNEIAATVFKPKNSAKYAVILSSATGTKQSFFQKFAEHLCEKGMLVVTYDYSGIGKSAPKTLKGYFTSAQQWGESDLAMVIDYVRNNYTYEKLIHIGQSIGGQIPGLTPAMHKADMLVNVGSQSGYWRMWPSPHRYGLLFNWYLLSFLTNVFGYFPGRMMRIMEDLPKGVALQWSQWGRSPNYLFDHVPDAHAKFAELKMPLLSYSFSDDTTAPRKTVEWLNERYANCPLTHKHVTPADIGVKSIGHFGFFRTSCKALWEDVIAEIEKV